LNHSIISIPVGFDLPQVPYFFALTLSPKAPTVGGTPRNHPDIARCFASSEQKYTSHSVV